MLAKFLGREGSSFGLCPFALIRHLELPYHEIHLGDTILSRGRYEGCSADERTSQWPIKSFVTLDALPFMETLLRTMERLACLDVYFSFGHASRPRSSFDLIVHKHPIILGLVHAVEAFDFWYTKEKESRRTLPITSQKLAMPYQGLIGRWSFDIKFHTKTNCRKYEAHWTRG